MDNKFFLLLVNFLWMVGLFGTLFTIVYTLQYRRKRWWNVGHSNNVPRTLVPLYLAATGASLREIAIVAAAYPLVWGVGQLGTGWLSDSVGRKPLIVLGMLVQAVALGVLAVGAGAFAPSLAAALLLGVGTAMVYPTLIAAVADNSQPRDRARIVSVYRFWRDFGFVLGALIAGVLSDLISAEAAIVAVAVLTAVSGGFVAATRWR